MLPLFRIVSMNHQGDSFLFGKCYQLAGACSYSLLIHSIFAGSAGSKGTVPVANGIKKRFKVCSSHRKKSLVLVIIVQVLHPSTSTRKVPRKRHAGRKDRHT